METQQTDNVMLTERDKYHEKLMVNILKNLFDIPLVLKDGTALYLGYGLNRFSKDLDFDSGKKLNLLNKIKASAPHGIVIDDINVKKDADTVSCYIMNYQNGSSKRGELRVIGYQESRMNVDRSLADFMATDMKRVFEIIQRL